MANIPNIDVEYDEEADVLYVTFGTGEPSYCENIDDIMAIELGVFSHLPTGFRVLDVRHHKIKSVGAMLGKIEPLIIERQKQVVQNHSQFMNEWRNQIRRIPNLDSITT